MLWCVYGVVGVFIYGVGIVWICVGCIVWWVDWFCLGVGFWLFLRLVFGWFGVVFWCVWLLVFWDVGFSWIVFCCVVVILVWLVCVDGFCGVYWLFVVVCCVCWIWWNVCDCWFIGNFCCRCGSGIFCSILGFCCWGRFGSWLLFVDSFWDGWCFFRFLCFLVGYVVDSWVLGISWCCGWFGWLWCFSFRFCCWWFLGYIVGFF